jgi:hypothetical protein
MSAFVDIQNVNITVGMSTAQKLALVHVAENQLEHIKAQIREVAASSGNTVTLDDGIETMSKEDWLIQANAEKAKLEVDIANLVV